MKAVFLQSLLLLALSVAGGVATILWHPYAPQPKSPIGRAGPGEVLVGEALRWSAEDKVVWIDARPRAEYEKKHAPDAYLINEAEWDDLMWESGPELMALTDKQFVVYCGNEDCLASTQIAEKLRARGFIGVYVLKGGWPALETALGFP